MTSRLKKKQGLTLVEIALATGLLALTTLTFGSAMTSSCHLDTQNRERTWARLAAQKQLEEIQSSSGQSLAATYSTPKDFQVGVDLNGDGVIGPGEMLMPAPPSGETPPRALAGRTTVDFSYPGLALVTISVRWRTTTGQPAELKLRADVAMDR